MSSSPSQLAQERYGRSPASPARRTRLLIVTGVVAVVVLVWIVWASVFSQPSVRWQDLSYSARTSSEITVTFDVFFARGAKEAVCTVQAQNELHTEVGLKDVRVKPGPKGRVRAVVTMPTSEQASTGLVKSCAAAK